MDNISEQFIDTTDLNKVSGVVKEKYTGNIDTSTLPVSDDYVQPVKSFVKEIDGKHVIIPANVSGKEMSEEEALEEYRRTGRHLGVYDTYEEADEVAEAINVLAGERYDAEDSRMMYEYDKRPTRNLAERELSEDGRSLVIPTDWTELGLVQDLAMNPFTFSPISPFGKNERIYSAFQAARGKNMVRDAYGINDVPERDVDIYRNQAALEEKDELEDLIIASAEMGINGAYDPRVIQRILSAPSASLDTSTSLEKKSIENPTEEALQKNLDLKMFQFNNALKMKDDDTDLFIKAQIGQSFIDLTEVPFADRTVFQKSMSILASLIPGYDTAKVATTDPLDVGLHFLSVTTRKKQKEIIRDAAYNLSQDEYREFLLGVYNVLTELTKDPDAVNSFFKETFGTPSIDPAIFLGIDSFAAAKGAVKGLKLVDKLFARNAKEGIEGAEAAYKVGDKVKIKEAVAETLKGTATDKAELDALKAITDTAMDINKDVVNTNSYRAYLEELAKAQSEVSLFDDTLQSIPHPTYITKDQQKFLEANVREYVNKQIAKTPVQNYFDYAQYSFERDANGNLQSFIDLATGSDNKQMFVSEEAAKSFIDKLPFLPGEAEAIQEVDGWKVRIKVNVPEKGVVLGYDGWVEDGKKWKMNRGLAYIRRTLGIPEETRKQDLAMATGKSSAKQKMWKKFNDVAKKLSKEEERQVDTVYKQSIVEAAADSSWDRYSDEVLKSRFGLNDKQIDVIHTFYNISDTAAAQKALSWTHMMNKKGMSEIGVKGLSEKVIGKQAEEMNKEVFSRRAFLDPSKLDDKGSGIYEFGEMTEDIWKDLEGKGYQAVRLWRPMLVEKGGKRVPVQYIIAPREDIVAKEVSPTYFGFHPEGSRNYSEDSFFLKQPDIMTSSSGTTLIGTSKTLFADTRLDVLKEQAKELNDVLKIYRPYAEGTADEVTTSIRLNEETAGNKWVRFSNVEDMEKNIGKDKLIPNYKYDFEVVRGGEELQQVATLKARGGMSLNEDEDFADVLYDLERMDKRGKGLLTTFQGDNTPIVGFSDMVERNINTIAYLKYNKPYAEYMGRELRQQFGDLIKPQYLSLSDEELLRNDKIFKDVPAGSLNTERVSAAKNLQDDYKLRINVKTDWDRWFENFGVATAEKLGLSKDSIAGKVIRDIEPTKLAKSWNWLNTMGGFNIKQFLTQAAGTYDAFLIAPKQTSRIMSRYMSIRSAIASETKEQLAESLKGVSRFGLINEKEAATLIDGLKRLAADSTEGRLSSYASVNGLKGLSDASTLFFREGEKMNAISAHGGAILDYLAEHPEKAGKALTNEELLEAFLVGDKRYLSMSTASTSKLERTPILSAATQFCSYTLSAIEALIGKSLTPQQKIRFLAGNLFAFGTAGTLGTPGYRFYGWLNDQGVSGEVTETMRTGVINGIIRAAGGHLDVSSLGPEFLTSGILGKGVDIVEARGVVDLARMVPAVSGIRTLADMPGTVKDAGAFLLHWIDPRSTDEQIIADLKALYNRDMPTGISNYVAAAIMVKSGAMYDKKGRLKNSDPDAWDIWGKVFGLERNYNAAYEMIQDIMEDKVDLAKEAADSLRVHFIRAHEKNDYQEYAQLKRVIINGLPWHTQREAEAQILAMETSIESLETVANQFVDKNIGKLTYEQEDKIREQLKREGVKYGW